MQWNKDGTFVLDYLPATSIKMKTRPARRNWRTVLGGNGNQLCAPLLNEGKQKCLELTNVGQQLPLCCDLNQHGREKSTIWQEVTACGCKVLTKALLWGR